MISNMQQLALPGTNAGPSRRGHFVWRQQLTILTERKWTVVATFLTVLGLTLLWAYTRTPIYRATAYIQVDSEAMRILNIQDVLSSDILDEQYFNTQIKVLQSRTLCQQVVEALRLDQDRDFMPDASPGADYAGALQGCLIVEPVRGSRLIQVSANHENPGVAARLADGVAQQFVRQNLDRKMSASVAAAHWLRQQADEYKLKVEKSEVALQQYRQQARAVSLEERQDVVVAKLKELNAAVTAVQKDRVTGETEWNEVQALLNAGHALAQVPLIANNPEVSALRRQLDEKQTAIAVTGKRYKEKHPLMIALLTEYSELTAKHAEACSKALGDIRAQYLMSKAKEDSLQRALDEQEQQALNLDQKQSGYLTLKRNTEADRALYDAILTRMKEATVTGKLEVNNARVLDPVDVPSTPYTPRKVRLIAVGILMGAFAGIALALLMDSFDDRMKTYEDVDSLGLPLLTGVPHIELGGSAQNARVLQLEPHSTPAEAFRNLRTSLSLSQNAKDANPLLVTSTAPGEGKSVVASNLCISFAANNQRTLLIDADMHQPILHTVFKVQGEKGLSLYLTDSVTWQEVVHKTDIPNLDVITVGPLPPNPPELLASDRMLKLLEEASREYDRVVIDTPPVTAVSDSLILLPHVKGVIFVVGFSKIRRDLVARTMQKLRECGAPLVGVVMNDIDAAQEGYYFYPYRYSYYNKHRRMNSTE